jgi:hypothetical protein
LTDEEVELLYADRLRSLAAERAALADRESPGPDQAVIAPGSQRVN